MESAEQNENECRMLETRGAGTTAQIREIVQKVESKTKCATPGKQARKVLLMPPKLLLSGNLKRLSRPALVL